MRVLHVYLSISFPFEGHSDRADRRCLARMGYRGFSAPFKSVCLCMVIARVFGDALVVIEGLRDDDIFAEATLNAAFDCMGQPVHTVRGIFQVAFVFG